MRLLDLLVILAYLVAIAAVGLRLSGRQQSAAAYFVGERDLPWWAICFSIVATETSTLTVISVPGVAYGGAFGFVELAIGYLLGRSLVAWLLLPLYMRGGFVSAYQYLRQRFGPVLQAVASATFLFTRLLAEGVRLFASAIPIKLLLDAVGVPASYVVIIAALSLVTLLYTYAGGIRAVIWTDAIQMALYVGGAAACVLVLLGEVGTAGVGQAYAAGKFQVINTAAPMLTSPSADDGRRSRANSRGRSSPENQVRLRIRAKPNAARLGPGVAPLSWIRNRSQPRRSNTSASRNTTSSRLNWSTAHRRVIRA